MSEKIERGELSMPFPLLVEDHFHDNYWKTIGRHQHVNVLQFFLMVKGNGIFYCGRQYHNISDGCCLLINSNEYHSFEGYGISAELKIVKIDLERLIFCFPMEYTAQYIRMIAQNHVLFQSSFDNETIRRDLLEIIRLMEGEEADSRLKVLSLLLEILYELYQNHVVRSLAERDAELLGQTWMKFRAVLEYIESNYENRLPLEQVAAFAGMSKGYFCSRFKQVTGKSYVDYLNRLRIEKALAELGDTDRPVIDVALSVGFDDVNYFCRVFKKYVNRSPTEYREMVRG